MSEHVALANQLPGFDVDGAHDTGVQRLHHERPLGAATMPRPVTTLSIGMNASAARLLSISVLITRVVLRASGCIGSVTRARLGPAKSRRAAAPSSG